MKPILRVGVVVIKDNRVLAVQHNYKHKTFWVPPGGGLEFGETIKDCAIREVKEETGLDIIFEKFLYLHDYFSEDSKDHILNIFVLAAVIGGRLKKGEDPDHTSQVIKRVEFLTISKLEQITFYPKILKNKIIQGLPDKGSYLGNSE